MGSLKNMNIKLNSGIGIGIDHKPFMIAEIGSNWSTLEDCFYSIRCAKVAGADAVKFQLFDQKALFGITKEASAVDYLKSKERRNADTSNLNPNWLPQLKAQADQVGIEFMCSAFSPKLAEKVDPFVNIHKIASAEMNHVRLLQKINSFEKPVILSTGASNVPDITQALSYLKVPVILMYCVASYPARDINLDNINSLSSVFDKLVGYSDHSIDIRIIPREAIRHGASVLEKHVNFVNSKGPDSGHSLDFEEFKTMIKVINNSINENYIGPTKAEEDMVTTHKRRLIATNNIMMGETFIEDKNFGIFRSLKPDTNGLTPFAVDHVNGKKAKRDIPSGDSIGPNDFF